jgi:alpha-galactosidase
MRDALYEAGRPIVLSLCEWGNDKPWEWGPKIGQLWRTTGDIYPCFDCVIDHGTWKQWGVMQILDMQDGLRKYAGPEHWNDPDMMEIGNGMSMNEDRAHFSMWCMLAAPLISGNDLRNMSKETLEILTNKEVIAVDQDPLGIQGFKFASADSVETWFKPLSEGKWAICFLNRSKHSSFIDFNWPQKTVIDDVNNLNANLTTTEYTLRNVWEHTDLGTTKKPLKVQLPAHDVIMLIMTPIKL